MTRRNEDRAFAAYALFVIAVILAALISTVARREGPERPVPVAPPDGTGVVP